MIPYKVLHCGVEPWEVYPAGAGSYDVGDPLALTSGVLGAGGATPTHVCMAKKTAAANEPLPCIPVTGDVIFECTAAEAETYTAAKVVGEVGGKTYIKF